jgi:hypothetical protein
MVVMSNTSQTESAKAEAQEPVLAAKHPDGVDDVLLVSKEMRQGPALLKVVAYPWGVEFEVCEAGVP